MKRTYDLAELSWTVEGYTPYRWTFERPWLPAGSTAAMDVRPVPARVPGSVQGALRDAGILPEWNIAFRSRDCEWVEHRHWIYRAAIPDPWLDSGTSFRLECLGLDYSGWVLVNRVEIGSFIGTHVPHVFDLTPHLKEAGNVLEIAFDLPPRWLGQFGRTSRMREWKTRFNYTWDWAPRLVQIGVWDAMALSSVRGAEICSFRCEADAEIAAGTGSASAPGILEFGGVTGSPEGAVVDVTLQGPSGLVRSERVSPAEFEAGVTWTGLAVDLWWPNLEGDRPLYTLTCRLLDAEGREQDRVERRVGFRHIEWTACEGAPKGADPWICVVNGRPVFLQGVNFAPLSVNFADLTRNDYERRLNTYQELGCNTLRINACQFLERTWFYDLCDELGLLVWQDIPLTSSGIDNWPPEDEESIEAMAGIAESFIERRRHHASLLLWAGGNELMGDLEGNKHGMGKPCDLNHPMLARLNEVAQRLDPRRRFLPTSPLGPRSNANPADYGKGLHWDVHGDACPDFEIDPAKLAADDALFRAELYGSGASPVEVIERYADDLPVWPPTVETPYWTRPTGWWIDWDRLVKEHGREPRDLAEYVAWSQDRQARFLVAEVKSCKDRFPRCGGVLLWCGHDTFPIPINSSIIDCEGKPKPSALALKEVWRSRPGWVGPTSRDAL